MSRHFYGDIEGKFWSSIQYSQAADRFGVRGTIPHYLDYSFESLDLEEVENEIEKITNSIGKETISIFDIFFKKVDRYNDKIMKEHGLDIHIWNKHKSDYADLCFGIKIRNCIKENGECHFSVEL